MSENKSILVVKSHACAVLIVKLYKLLIYEKREYVLSKQLLRCGTSVGANIREARNAVSKKDFIHKLTIAQKECDESLYWLELLTEFIEHEYIELVKLRKEASELLLILSAIILKTKQNANWTKRLSPFQFYIFTFTFNKRLWNVWKY